MTIDERLERIEARLRAAEDRLAIIDLLARYGPAVDSGECRFAAETWVDDGAYDIGGMVRATGHDAISALYEADMHQGFIARGSAHLTGTPTIRIDGDSAEAVAHSFVILRAKGADGAGEGGWTVYRASANYWRLVRTAAGWRIAERRNHLLDGSPASHALLARVTG